jgi:PAS domain S-box-containing protein
LWGVFRSVKCLLLFSNNNFHVFEITFLLLIKFTTLKGERAFIIHPDDRKRVFETLPLSNRATPYQIEYRIVRSNGEVRYIVENTEFFTNEFDEWLGAIGTTQDITENKNLRLRLIEEEQYYKSLFENSKDAVYSFDLQGNILSCNAVFEETFGYSKEELLNSGFHHLIEPGSLQKTQAYFMETIRTLSSQNYETTCIHRNGEIIELNVTKLPIIINR